MQIDFPSMGVKRVRRRAVRIELRNRRTAGSLGQEVHMQRTFRFACGEKRIRAYGFSHLLSSSQDHRGAEAKRFGDLFRDVFRQLLQDGSGCVEKNISALNVSRNIAASRCREHLDQIFHGQTVLASDIDAAKQGDIHFGKAQENTTPPPLVTTYWRPSNS